MAGVKKHSLKEKAKPKGKDKENKTRKQKAAAEGEGGGGAGGAQEATVKAQEATIKATERADEAQATAVSATQALTAIMSEFLPGGSRSAIKGQAQVTITHSPSSSPSKPSEGYASLPATRTLHITYRLENATFELLLVVDCADSIGFTPPLGFQGVIDMLAGTRLADEHDAWYDTTASGAGAVSRGAIREGVVGGLPVARDTRRPTPPKEPRKPLPPPEPPPGALGSLHLYPETNRACAAREAAAKQSGGGG